MAKRKPAVSQPGNRKATHRKAPTLKPRQAKYLEGVVAGKTRRQAALDAGYGEYTANHAVERLENSPELQRALAEKMPPVEYLARKVVEGLEAFDTKFANFEGEFSDSRDVVAWRERREYLELALRLKGLMPGEKIDVTGQLGGGIEVVVTHVGRR